MATRTAVFNRGIMDLVYLNIPFAGIGDVTGLLGSNTAGSLFVGLLDDSGEEISYAGYSRQAIPRGAGFIRQENVISNVPHLLFGAVPSEINEINATQAAIFSDATNGFMCHLVSLSSPIVITTGNEPAIKSGSLQIIGAELEE